MASAQARCGSAWEPGTPDLHFCMALKASWTCLGVAYCILGRGPDTTGDLHASHWCRLQNILRGAGGSRSTSPGALKTLWSCKEASQPPLNARWWSDLRGLEDKPTAPGTQIPNGKGQ